MPLGSGPFHGVSSPSALEERGVRFTRGFQAPARSGSRVSHPPAGLLLPAPPGSISPRWHSWGSALQGLPLPRSCATSQVCAIPSWRSLPRVADVHGFVSRGRPSPAHLGFAAGPFSPSGPCSPRESVRRDDRVYARHTSVPSWASASLRLSPPGKMGRISPPLLSRASSESTPEVALR